MAGASFSSEEIIQMILELTEVHEHLMSSDDWHMAMVVDGVSARLTNRLFGVD